VATELVPGVYWVGAIDWTLRDFHGYSTEAGSTYNAYLIVDDKVTLIDAVKEGFVPEMMGRISDIIDPEKSTISSPTTWRWTIPGGWPRWWTGSSPKKSSVRPRARRA
jgi:hypothetical protein